MNNAAQMLSFEGHTVRVVQDPTGRLVPLNDVADAVGRGREGLRQLVNRDELLKEWSATCVTQATDGKPYQSLCLTEPGVVRLLGMLNPERSATPESRAKVLAFGRWAATRLVKVMRGEVMEPAFTWVSTRQAGVALGLPRGTIRERLDRYHLPVRRDANGTFLALEALQANLETYPIKKALGARYNTATQPRQEITSPVLAELRRIYGPEGARAVLHRMNPKLFPNPKTLPGGFQPGLEVRP